MITFQDLTNAIDGGMLTRFVADSIAQHKASSEWSTACAADEYDAQRNVTINTYVKTILSNTGVKIADYTASNNKIASNFFRRLNTQRCMYSLGNGVSFADENIKPKLGNGFDSALQKAGYYALIHGRSFMFWNKDRVHVFPLTEFVPMHDEDTGALRAGIRFWQIDSDRPMIAVLYEEDGYTRFRSKDSSADLEIVDEKKPYKMRTSTVRATGSTEVIDESNYSAFPIVPLYGSRIKQSTLVGMQQSIDSYDLIRSGFANDLSDCAQIYWIISSCGGMSEADLGKFRENLMFRHIASAPSDDDEGGGGGVVQPYTQEIPFQARKTYLDSIRQGIYEDFGALDVYSISAANQTATAIEAAYQPLDENADDFEYQIIDAVERLLELQGITGEDAVPLFNRNRIANQKELTDIVMECADYLDDRTVLSKLPIITPDEVDSILEARDQQDMNRFGATEPDEPEDE